MLEQFLPFLAPKNEFQGNAAYLANLYGMHQLIDRLFPSDKEKVENLLAKKQLEMLEGSEESPLALAALAPVAAGLNSKLARDIVYEMPKKKQISLSQFLPSSESNVVSDFMRRRKAAMLAAKSNPLRILKGA